MLPNCELVKVDGTQFLVFKGQDLISNYLKQELYENRWKCTACFERINIPRYARKAQEK